MPRESPRPHPMALALEWVSRILVVTVEMVGPGLLGQWLDDRWGVSFLGLLGFAIGIPLGLVHLLVMTRQQNSASRSSRSQSSSHEKDQS